MVYLDPVYVIRFNDGSGFHVKSFRLTVMGGEVHVTLEPLEALHFSSWEEAAAVVAFIVFHFNAELLGMLEVAKYLM